MGSNYRIRMAANKTAEILIYEEIGEGFFGGIGAKRFADDLKALGALNTIKLRVNSPGGDVFEALAMYNTLARHPAVKEVDIDGMALSAATIVIMAGHTIRMAENAMLMIHDPWTIAMGSADDLEKTAGMLRDVKDNIITTYNRRTGIAFDRLAEMMTEETWMKPVMALEEGFVDEITDPLAIAAHFDARRFKNAPEEWLAHHGRAEQPKRSDLVRAKLRDLAQRAA